MNMMKKAVFAVAISSAFVVNANAGDLNYNYLDIDYVSRSSGGLDGSGFGIDASFDVSDNVNIYAGYEAPDFSGSSVTETIIGVGFHQSTSETADWYGKIDYRSFNNILNVTFSGFAISGGARAALSKNFELDGYLGYADYQGFNGLIFGIDGAYKFGEKFAITAGYMSNDAIPWTGFNVGARMYF